MKIILFIILAGLVWLLAMKNKPVDRYEEGWRAGVQWCAKAFIEGNAYLAPLEVTTDATIENCVFIQIIKPEPLLSVGDLSGINVKMQGLKLWAGGIVADGLDLATGKDQ